MSDPYDNALLDYEGALKQTDNHENILQKAAKAMSMSPQQAGYEFTSGNLLPNLGMNAASAFTGAPKSLGMGATGEAMRQKAVGNNPILDLATDPMVYASIAEGGGAFKGAINDLRNPSVKFGNAIKNATGKVDVHGVIQKALDDPITAKVLRKSGVIAKYGGSSMDEAGAITEKLSNLSVEDSQKLLNSIKDNISLAEKRGILKPTHLGIQELISGITGAQEKAFPGIVGEKGFYGFAKNLGKGVKETSKNVLRGVAEGAGIGAGYPIVKHLLGR